jgi:hypothetical protein
VVGGTDDHELGVEARPAIGRNQVVEALLGHQPPDGENVTLGLEPEAAQHGVDGLRARGSAPAMVGAVGDVMDALRMGRIAPLQVLGQGGRHGDESVGAAQGADFAEAERGLGHRFHFAR